HETNDTIYLKVMAGEPWHELVQYCVAKNWGGIENLSLIPGNTGAAPIQNIGAYGVEIKDVIHEVEAIQLSDGKK
ncbi:FAD-binding protein, partial [Escherichia coli]|uniref:FAD-binding protein n=1 Tax=Escherichia coli TaxID=562 RepID=UPI003CEB4723